MLNLAIVYFFFGYNISLYFIVFNVILAIYYYFHIKNSYYNKIKDKETGKNIHEVYTAYNRRDNPPSLFRLIFGLLSFVWIKAILICVVLVNCWLSFKVFRACVSKEKYYYSFNFKCSLWIYSWTANAMAVISGLFFVNKVYNKEEVTKIYKKYFGETFDYEKEIKSKKFSIFISNHIGWIDIYYLGGLTGASFCAKNTIEKMPVIGYCSNSVNTLWINREDREKNKGMMIELNKRQESIMNGEQMNKVILFPEGTGSNNTSINEFKKGSFFTCLPIKPYMVLTHGNGTIKELGERKHNDNFSLATGVMNMFTHQIVSYCYLYFDDFVLLDLPVMTPTEYMYKTYEHFASDKSGIFAEVTRNIFAEICDLKTTNYGFSNKLEYLSKIKGKTIKNT